MTVATEIREQTRARYPDEEGFVERDGVRVFWERYGEGEQTILLLPTWSVVHSRIWKMQIPYLARHCQVLLFDGRGNGRSDRPAQPEAYAESEFAADALAVMDATQTSRAIIVGFSMGAHRGLMLAANHPERVEAAVFIGPNYPGGGQPVGSGRGSVTCTMAAGTVVFFYYQSTQLVHQIVPSTGTGFPACGRA